MDENDIQSTAADTADEPVIDTDETDAELDDASDSASMPAPESVNILSKFFIFINKIYFIKKIKDVPAIKKQRFAIILLIALIIVTAGVFFYFYNLANVSAIPENAVFIKMPANRLNNSNYIFPSVIFELDGNPVAIQKMVIDSLATVFYLDTALSFDGMPVSVKDEAGNVYEPDYACIGDETGVLFFKPFSAPIKHFTLEIADVSVYFYIEGGFVESPAAYSAGSADIYDGSAFILGDGSFSNAVSRINYLTKKDGAGVYVFDGIYGDALLVEGASRYAPVSHYQYTFGDGVIIGRYDFPPLMSLESNINFEISGLFKRYAPGTEFRITTHDRDIVFEIGEYEVTVEGFARQGDYYVLVLHGAGLADGGRVETRLSARLAISAGTDEDVIIDSFCYSGPIGSDVLFDVSSVKDRLAGNELIYTVEVMELTFLTDDIYTSLNMTESAPGNGDAAAAALLPYGDNAQLAAYIIDGDKMYAAVLERIDGTVVTHTDVLINSDGNWTGR